MIDILHQFDNSKSGTAEDRVIRALRWAHQGVQFSQNPHSENEGDSELPSWARVAPLPELLPMEEDLTALEDPLVEMKVTEIDPEGNQLAPSVVINLDDPMLRPLDPNEEN